MDGDPARRPCDDSGAAKAALRRAMDADPAVYRAVMAPREDRALSIAIDRPSPGRVPARLHDRLPPAPPRQPADPAHESRLVAAAHEALAIVLLIAVAGWALALALAWHDGSADRPPPAITAADRGNGDDAA